MPQMYLDYSELDIKKIREEVFKQTQSEFSEAIGVKFRTYQNYELNGIPVKKIPEIRKAVAQYAENIGVDYIAAITDTVQEPSAVWVEYNRFKLVPLVTHRAQAGFLSGWGDDEYLDELPKVPWEVDKEYKGKYLTFEVAGDSMESPDAPRESLYPGDLLLCREVGKPHWKNRLHISQWDFVVVHRDQGILVKRITAHDTSAGILTLHSLNPYYEDFTVQMDDLVAIFNIVDVKRSRRR